MSEKRSIRFQMDEQIFKRHVTFLFFPEIQDYFHFTNDLYLLIGKACRRPAF